MREGGSEGGRKGVREGGREGGSEGVREGGREGGREEKRKGREERGRYKEGSENRRGRKMGGGGGERERERRERERESECWVRSDSLMCVISEYLLRGVWSGCGQIIRAPPPTSLPCSVGWGQREREEGKERINE